MSYDEEEELNSDEEFMDPLEDENIDFEEDFDLEDENPDKDH